MNNAEMAIGGLKEQVDDIFHKWIAIAEDMKRRGASLNGNVIADIQREIDAALERSMQSARIRGVH